jgi:DNA polymerase
MQRLAADPPVDLTAGTLRGWLAADTAGGLVRELVETKLDHSNTSGTKLAKMLAWTSTDGRARGCFLWHGAHTGRWSGRGIQPQNLPRTPDGFDFDATIASLLRTGGPAHGGGDLSVKIRIARCLRGMIKAPAGMRLVVCDFSQIESRTLCWIAGQQSMLDTYRRGEDPYIATAQLLGSNTRQFGKLIVLAAGFGGGSRMLLAKAPEYDVQLTELEAEQAIYAWREANPEIVAFWDALHETMRGVVEMPVGCEREVQGLLIARTDDDTLRIKLPSGRSLIYHQPRINPDEEYSWLFNITYQQAGPGDWQRKKSWRGLATENVVQAIAYDLMADAMLRMDADGIELIGTVHDEAIALAPAELADTILTRMKQIMSTPPDWASGLPLAAQGYHSARYMKQIR